MNRKFTLWIAVFALCAGGGSVARAQNPERDVNNEFGAGESAMITAGAHASQNVVSAIPAATGVTGIAYSPTFSNTLSIVSPPDIRLGSSTGANTVIRAYSGHGFAIGWVSVVYNRPQGSGIYPNDNYYSLNILRRYNSSSNRGQASPGLTEFSFNKFNVADMATTIGNCGNLIFSYLDRSRIPSFNTYEIAITPQPHTGLRTTGTSILYNGADYKYIVLNPTPVAPPVGLYTSSMESTYNLIYGADYHGGNTYTFPEDDGIGLVQFTGDYMTDGKALESQKSLLSDQAVPLGDVTAPTWHRTDAQYLANYRRPTTIIVDEGDHTFANLTIGDIQWRYERDSVAVTPATIGEFSTCGAGNSKVYSFAVRWNQNVEIGKTLVDGAIRIRPNATVHVEGNTEDITTNIASVHAAGASPDTKTDAILVVPSDGRFTLRTRGNFDRLNMWQEPTGINLYYSQGNFPQSNDSIYLPLGNQQFDFSPYHLLGRNATLNTCVDANGILAPKPYTYASVFGVYGDYIYTNYNADIYTTQTPGGGDGNPGVIEVGPTTQGQEHFHILSGGTLKNFEGVGVNTNFALNVGVTGDKNTPSFTIDAPDTLYILNYGNNEVGNACAAAIHFDNNGVDTLSWAVANAVSTGAVQIQARGTVDFRKDVAFDATAQNNNLYLLSDSAHVLTKDFGYRGDGNMVLWANGLPAPGCGGYVLMDGVVRLETDAAEGRQAQLTCDVDNDNLSLQNGSCDAPSSMPAAYDLSNPSKIQARIQSQHDYVHFADSFIHTSKGAALLVQGGRHVQFDKPAVVDYTGAVTAGKGDAAIQSRNSYVLFSDSFLYRGGLSSTDILVDGETGVRFEGGGRIAQLQAGRSEIHPNIGVQANDGTVLFKNKPFAFHTANTDQVQVWAGKNIDVQTMLTYDDADGSGTHVYFYAGDSILTNALCTGAPVYFTAGNRLSPNTLTDWVAGGNIHTRDTVLFAYGNTGNHVEDLTLKSLGGNIVMDRYTEVRYDGDSTIRLSAEIPCAEKNTPVNTGYTGATGGNRNTSNGNILLNDSVKITRSNPTAGNTDMLAKYHIRTAMVTLDDTQSTGNNVNVISAMGDVFLGYSTLKDNCAPVSNTSLSYDNNRFVYTTSANNVSGKLDIKAGYDDQTNTNRDGGGNIYFTHIDATMGTGGNHSAELSIPFSNEYSCGLWDTKRLYELGNGNNFGELSRVMYEHAGIIGGVGPCGNDRHSGWSVYAPALGVGVGVDASDTSLIYRGNRGDLRVDAGTRGNIIMNRGVYLNWQNPQNTGHAFFRTRNGNIDMRDPFNVDSLRGGLVLLASGDLPDKLKTDACNCDEEKNNVYLQDFEYRSHADGGSVYIGADNNIKLQYGGLKTVGTMRDPFFSPNNNLGYPCLAGGGFHCDAAPSENRARSLRLNFSADAAGAPITGGGFGAVASDRIDVYKDMVYVGGQGAGMPPVPAYGDLHGENVAGYGLFIKAQANKENWTKSAPDEDHKADPTQGAACNDEGCGNSYLHNTARVTFHSDAYIHTQAQRSLIESPVLDVYGHFDLDTHNGVGARTNITIRTDSLILHDSVIVDGPHTTPATWTSDLRRNVPVVKLGHHRFTPPFTEDRSVCPGCFTHPRDPYGNRLSHTDTIHVTFRNGGSLPRLHTLVADHAVITFLTDSADHTNGVPVTDAKIFTDTFKIRDHVELWTASDHTRDGYFELISEEQMLSKDYAGIYARHLHMEPVAPECSNYKAGSQLWLSDPTQAVNVITTSTFGGFGWVHHDVYVQTEATLAPGFASLGRDGNCYEQFAGILKMQELRLDKGAHIRVSLGDRTPSASRIVKQACPDGGIYRLGEYADLIDVDSILLHGDVFIDPVIRSEGIEIGDGGRCFPIIRFKSASEFGLNNLKLKRYYLSPEDHPSIERRYALSFHVDMECGIVSLCVVPDIGPVVIRRITIPEVTGVTSTPPAGIHFINSHHDFKFSALFPTVRPLKVATDRVLKVEGGQELVEGELKGVPNADGAYEYVIRDVRQDVRVFIGPEYTANEPVEDSRVWAHRNTVYFRMDREDTASIYLTDGRLVKRIDAPEGLTTLTLERGLYIITLKDGSVHKVIVK